MESVQPNERHERPAIEFCCGRCSKVVMVCQCCWRNQKSYRMTSSGRAKHIEQQKAYRARKKIQE